MNTYKKIDRTSAQFEEQEDLLQNLTLSDLEAMKEFVVHFDNIRDVQQRLELRQQDLAREFS